MLKKILDVQKRIVPDLLQVMMKRYHILRYIRLMQPVGRRSLSQSLEMTERVLRGETQFLKEQNLLNISNAGMTLTEEGYQVLDALDDIVRDLSGFPKLEKQLSEVLHVEKCIVVMGDSENSSWDKSELARACVNSMKQVIEDNNIIAVTGGSTVAAVADHFTQDFGKKDLLFVPARGGLGSDLQNQANVICSKMAERTGGRHMVLYVPDQVSEEMYQSFIQEPSIREVINAIHTADLLLHGIGDALTMARRRNSPPELIEKLIREKAVAEAFGYYFNEEGEVVHKITTVGIRLEKLKDIPHIYAVAGGKSKAKAINAYMKVAPKNTVLVTDEAAALEIIKG